MLEPIYKGRTYSFSYAISINGLQVNVNNDEVWLSLDLNLGTDNPAFRKLMDVSTGIPTIELTPADTNQLTLNEYYIQINWKLSNSDKNFQIMNEKIRVLPVIK